LKAPFADSGKEKTTTGKTPKGSAKVEETTRRVTRKGLFDVEGITYKGRKWPGLYREARRDAQGRNRDREGCPTGRGEEEKWKKDRISTARG